MRRRILVLLISFLVLACVSSCLGVRAPRITQLTARPAVQQPPAEGWRHFVLSFRGLAFGELSYELTFAGDSLNIAAQSSMKFASSGMTSTVSRATSTRWSWPGCKVLDSQLEIDTLAAGEDAIEMNIRTDPGRGTVTAEWGPSPEGEATLECEPPGLLLEPNVFGGEGLEMLAQLIDWDDPQAQMVTSLDPSMAYSELTIAALAFPARVSLVGQARLRVAGRTVNAAVLDLVLPFYRYRAYYAVDTGRLVRYELPQAGVVAELVAAPPSELGAADMAALSRMAFQLSMWETAGVQVKDPFGLEGLECDIELAVAAPAWADPLRVLDAGRQAFTGQIAYDRGVWSLSGRLRSTSAQNGPWEPGETADGTPALGSGVGSELGLTRPGPRIESDHPLIAAKAREITAAGPGTYWGAVRQVVGWVAANVSPEVTFGSALSALETLRGDCVPRAYLSVAMLRSLGVPARPIYGLMLIGSEVGTHVWVEAYLGPEIGWVEVDPIKPAQLEMLSAAHIRLSHESAIVAPAIMVPKVTVTRVEY